MNKQAIATTIEITSISKVTRKDDGTRYWVYNLISGASSKKYAVWATLGGHVCWCDCKDHEFHPGRSCKHMTALQEKIDMKKEQRAAVASVEHQLADEIEAKRTEQLAEAATIAESILGQEFTQDLAVHVDDSLASGELAPWEDLAWDAMSRQEQSEAYRNMYSDDYYCDYAA